MKKPLSIFCALLLVLSLTGCGQEPAQPTGLSFSDAVSLERLSELNGQKVSIVGYMATLSPVSGKYMYLMNMPYQSCPFCVPNTTQLSNTMAVYAPDGKTFPYTDQAIRVTGTLRLEECTDEFGYTYNYRIADASYEVVDLSALSENYALWQAIASDGVVGEINAMFDYLYFLCCWPDYQSSYTDEDGNSVTFFLYPGDVEMYLTDDTAYGYATEASADYFPGLISRVRAISADGLDDLVSVIEQAEIVSGMARADLNDGAYAYDEDTDKFTLNRADELYEAWREAYLLFSDWLAKWEL